MNLKRVQLNRWVLEETLEYLNQIAKLRGYKQGPMMDKVVQEYKDPTVGYLMDKLLEKLPQESYFTELEKRQLKQLQDMIKGLIGQ